MRILIFTDWFYPAFKAGGPVQSIVNLVELLKDQHELFVYTSDRDLDDDHAFPGVQTDQWIEQNGYTIQYHSPGKMTYKAVRSIVSEIGPDRIYLNSMFSNMILPLLAAYRSGRIILAPRGMLRPSALQVKPIRKFLYLSLLKTLGMERHIRFHATSAEEEQDIKKIFPLASDIRVAANLSVKVQERWRPLSKSSGELKLIFVGRIHPIKNLFFLLEVLEALLNENRVPDSVHDEPGMLGKRSGLETFHDQTGMPRVRAEVPQTLKLQLTIVATIDDKTYWEICKEKLAGLENLLSVQLHLDCPHEKVTELLQAAHLFVLPTLGENFGHAIFEALSVGCPVLISDQTPWRNLDARQAGMEVPLDSAKFAAQIQRFLDMPQQEWEQFRRGALELAKAHELNQHAAEDYKKLLEIA